MNYVPKLSLPRLMAHYAEPRKKPMPPPDPVGVVPGSASGRSRNKKDAQSGRPTTSDSARSRPTTTDSKCSSARTPIIDESGWPLIGGGLGAFKKAQSLFETDTQTRRLHAMHTQERLMSQDDGDEYSEFMRKRQAHPRLRWPRLASRGDIVRAGLEESAIPTTPGSPSSSSRNPPSRPAILPRANSRAPVRPGTTSTMHVALGNDFDEEQEFDDERSDACSEFESHFAAAEQYLQRSQNLQSSIHSASQESSRSDTQMLDRKWLMRMTPISCLPSEPSLQVARRALAEKFDTVTSETGEYMDYKGWGVNDDYLDALLSSHYVRESGGCKVQFVNLSENQITEKGVSKLEDYGVPDNLKSLNLASNRLDERGGLAVLRLTESCSRLVDLDLSGNAIGDGVAEELCGHLVKYCHDLGGLSLARCQLGASKRAGEGLGNLVSTAQHLKSLDLHWNLLHGAGAHSFIKGLYESGTGGLKLTQLTISWNRLGSGLNPDEQRKNDALRSAKNLASVFAEGEVLFHVDMSYNGFDAEECEILSQGLKSNHTLFGLHLNGNAATVDDLGFVVPISREPQARVPEQSSVPQEGAEIRELVSDLPTLSLSKGEEQQLRLNKYVRSVPPKFRKEHQSDLDEPCKDQETLATSISGDRSFQWRQNPSLKSLAGDGHMTFSDVDLQAEHNWIRNRSRVQPVGRGLASSKGAFQRNTSCCWICENWVEHKVTYTLGLSGHEKEPDDVLSVYALYSIDGFTRPTKLTRHEEALIGDGSDMTMPQEVIVMLQGGNQSKINRRASRRMSAAPRAVMKDGKIIKWVGVRMLPPTTEPLEVVFVVNGQVTVANDLRKKSLKIPKTINMNLNGNEEKAEEGASVVSVAEVNLIAAGLRYWEQLKSGMAKSLVVLEDPNKRGDVIVLPRRLVEVEVKAKAKEAWTYETSCFKEFLRDSDSAIEKCCDVDWQHNRLNQIIKEESQRKAVKAYMRPVYLPIMMCFRGLAFSGFDQKVFAAGITFNNFREWLLQAGGQGPGKFIDGSQCKLNDPDCIFIAANVIEKSKRKELKVMPDKGLARFQFQEAVVRLAFRRFLTGSSSKAEPEVCVEAVERFIGMVKMGEEITQLRTELHKSLFTEECCLTFREHMDMLKAVYEGYKVVSCYPGRAGKQMSYGAWMELVQDSGICDEVYTTRNIGLAFALAKEIRADVTSDWKFMELSWGEFLVALGALVVLKKDYCKEFIADLLEELFLDNIEEARRKVQDKKPGKARNNKQYDPSMAPLIHFLGRMFEDADDDGGGSVDQREFRRVFNDPKYKSEMEKFGVNVSELEMLFRALDRDGSGELTLDDLCEGFVKMKNAMKGIDRAISYIRKAFAEADKDGSGSLDQDEFRHLFEHPNTVKKLSALGVTSDDVEDLFSVVSNKKEGNGEVNVEQIIEGFVRLRDPKNAGLRGLRILEKLFEEADEDQSGELSKDECCGAFGNEAVVEKLQSAKLKAPDWATLFEELDVDGSGGLSWEEIAEGMKAFWAKDTLSSM